MGVHMKTTKHIDPAFTQKEILRWRGLFIYLWGYREGIPLSATYFD